MRPEHLDQILNQQPEAGWLVEDFLGPGMPVDVEDDPGVEELNELLNRFGRRTSDEAVWSSTQMMSPG